MSIPYVTRSNPDKQNLLSEIENGRNKNITSELASLKLELQENHSWLNTAKKIAVFATVGLAAAACLYECYHLQQSNQTIFELNVEYGKETWRNTAQEIFQKLAKDQPSWYCTMGSEKVSLIDCFARGMADYFKNKD